MKSSSRYQRLKQTKQVRKGHKNKKNIKFVYFFPKKMGPPVVLERQASTSFLPTKSTSSHDHVAPSPQRRRSTTDATRKKKRPTEAERLRKIIEKCMNMNVSEYSGNGMSYTRSRRMKRMSTAQQTTSVTPEAAFHSETPRPAQNVKRVAKRRQPPQKAVSKPKNKQRDSKVPKEPPKKTRKPSTRKKPNIKKFTLSDFEKAMLSLYRGISNNSLGRPNLETEMYEHGQFPDDTAFLNCNEKITFCRIMKNIGLIHLAPGALRGQSHTIFKLVKCHLLVLIP